MVTVLANRSNGTHMVETLEPQDNPPMLDDVLDLIERYRRYYTVFRNQCDQEEDWYFGRVEPKVPAGIDPVIPATARALINVATDHIDVSHISIDVPLASVRAKARAERIMKFLQGAWASVKEPVLRTLVRHQFTYGIGWLKLMWDADKWPYAPVLDDFASDEDYKEALSDFMDKRDITFPFRVTNVNPKFLLWDDSKIRTKWAIEIYDRQARDIRYRYPEWVSALDNNSMASWVEYWDEDWVGYIADREWVWGPVRHHYGFLPYIQALPANSMNLMDGKPEERYQGVLYPVHSLLMEEARLMSQYSTLMKVYAWRTLDFVGNQASAEKTRQNYEIFGGMNVVPTGVEVRASPYVPPPPEILQELNIVQTAIEMATFPNVIRGVRPKGVSAGFGISILAGMARLVFQGVADGTSRCLERVNTGFLKLVENKAGEKVTVHARSEVHSFDQGIGPEDIKGYHENIVGLKAEAPEERERQSLLARQLYTSGMTSLYEAQKRIGIINPLEEQMQMAAERLLQSPEIQMAMSQLAAERLGLLSQLAEATGAPAGEGVNIGNQFLPGLSQLQRPGEANIQQARIAARQGEPSVFPQGLGGIQNLGRRMGTPGGGAVGVPSGQTVR